MDADKIIIWGFVGLVAVCAVTDCSVSHFTKQDVNFKIDKLVEGGGVHEVELFAVGVEVLDFAVGHLGGFDFFLAFEGFGEEGSGDEVLYLHIDDGAAAAHDFLGVFHYFIWLAV